MIFTKQGLIESVLNEIGVEDVLNPDWQKDANETMDIEFYREEAEPFWDAMASLLRTLKQMPPEKQKKWAYDQKWDSSVVQHFPELMHMIDMKWIQSKLTDQQIYDTKKRYQIGTEGMLRLAEIELSYLLSRYLF